MFGYPGGSNLKLFDQLYNDTDILVNRHEQFSGYSAEGYSKSSKNNIGVVITTSGPGLTNIITPLQDATSDGVALLAISGQVDKTKLKTSAFQECDAISITSSCVKYNKLITNILELEYELEKAFKIATTNRKGAVHLDICSNVFNDIIEDNHIIEYDESTTKIAFDINIHNDIVDKFFMLNNIKNALIKSKKPVIIVGQGCIECFQEIRNFCDINNIPVCTTLHGLGLIDETSLYSLGMVGMHGNYAANMAVQQSDFILGIGYRFDDRTTGHLDYYGINARNHYGIAHVDISPEKILEVKKQINPKYSLNMSIKKFINKLTHSLQYKLDNNKNNYVKWLNVINRWKNIHNFTSTPDMTITHISEKLSNELNKKDIDFLITTGVGVHQMQVAQYFTWKKPYSLVTSGSQGTMGVGLPFAIGAKLANPNKLVICIDGDGSFMMSCQELQTINEHNINLKIIIMDNESLQMVQNWQDEFYNSRFSGSKIKNPDFVKLANSMGIDAIKCSSLDTLDDTIDQIINFNGPLLVHFTVKQTKCLPFVAPGKALDDMILK